MPEYDEQGNPVEVIAAIQAGARENYNALMEAAVQRATDAVCDFDPDAAAYRARTEAWVRLALTVALAPPDGGHSSTPEPAAAGGAERSQSPEQTSAVAAVREAAGDKLLIAQRNEAKREADELLAAGNYLLAALRFYVPRPVGAYYSDFHAAARRWEDVAGPVREAAGQEERGEVAEMREAITQALSAMTASGYVDGGITEREAWQRVRELLEPYRIEHKAANPAARVEGSPRTEEAA